MKALSAYPAASEGTVIITSGWTARDIAPYRYPPVRLFGSTSTLTCTTSITRVQRSRHPTWLHQSNTSGKSSMRPGVGIDPLRFSFIALPG